MKEKEVVEEKCNNSGMEWRRYQFDFVVLVIGRGYNHREEIKQKTRRRKLGQLIGRANNHREQIEQNTRWRKIGELIGRGNNHRK